MSGGRGDPTVWATPLKLVTATPPNRPPAVKPTAWPPTGLPSAEVSLAVNTEEPPEPSTPETLANLLTSWPLEAPWRRLTFLARRKAPRGPNRPVVSSTSESNAVKAAASSDEAVEAGGWALAIAMVELSSAVIEASASPEIRSRESWMSAWTSAR